jgi:hypothetical protein
MMGLKKGDVLTLSIAPTISLGDYTFLKPHASIERKITEAPEATVSDMRVELRKRLFDALKVEIMALSDISTALGGTHDIDGLLERCEKEIGNAEADTVAEVDAEEEPEVVKPAGKGKPKGKPKGKVKVKPKLKLKKPGKAQIAH